MSVILINPFEVPAGREDECLAYWDGVADYMRRQPGFVSTRLHRAIAPDARFAFINVAEWETPADFQRAVASGGVSEARRPRRRTVSALPEPVRNRTNLAASGPHPTSAFMNDSAVAVEDAKSFKEVRRDRLYAEHVKVYPKDVQGRFRRIKWMVLGVLLGIYYVVPWIRWERGPGAPDQAVLIDMPSRRAYFFWVEIWPQEVYYLTFLLMLAAFGLFLATSLAGRVWCGFTCPQTVWTDLFMRVERRIEGDRGARIRLDKAPLSSPS